MPPSDPYAKAARNVQLVVNASFDDADRGLAIIGTEIVNTTRRMVTNPSPSQPGEPPGLVTGGLRLSYKWAYLSRRGRYRSIEVGSDASTRQPTTGRRVVYACVFDAHTRVSMEKGTKTIGQVRPGDSVLTQTGEFREVVAVSSFPAHEKPDLVEIHTPWRADRDHVITVTADHKIMAWRDGRNKWIEAGDLLMTDQLYMRRKVAHNKAPFGKYPERICMNCETPYRKQGKQFCTTRCRADYWTRTGTNPHSGVKRSAETCALIGEKVAKAMAAHPEKHPSRIVAQRGFRTDLERQVEAWLIMRGLDFEVGFPVGRSIVDFWIPSLGEVVEADGAFWHQDQAVDIARDLRLLDILPGSRITHLHFYDKRFTPQNWDPNPLPDVHYIACNPGPDTYVDPEACVAVSPKSIRPWRFDGRKTAMLYDLAVDGVHSFFANGLLVSNSYLEAGTSQMEPRPHFRPSVLLVRKAMPAHFARAIANAQRRKARELRANP